MSKSKIILPSNNTASISLKEIAKILTATEGKTSPDKVEEIFRIFFGINEVKTGLNDFFRKSNEPAANVFGQWIETVALTDVLATEFHSVNWHFAVRGARIPKDIYEETGPERAIHLAGASLGQSLTKNVYFMYGDSREYKGPCSTGNTFKNSAFFFGYKENVSKYA